MTLRDRGITDPTRWAIENGIEMVKPMDKHRYFQFIGAKRDKKKMLEKLNYAPVKDYPKCDQRRYNDGPDLLVIV
jgi:predicted RNA-binding protein